jgi:hypothetical protein
VLEPVPRSDERLYADLLGRELESTRDVLERLVADAVEAGLNVPLSAGDDVLGDLLGGQIGVTPVVRAIGVRLP